MRKFSLIITVLAFGLVGCPCPDDCPDSDASDVSEPDVSDGADSEVSPQCSTPFSCSGECTEVMFYSDTVAPFTLQGSLTITSATAIFHLDSHLNGYLRNSGTYSFSVTYHCESDNNWTVEQVLGGDVQTTLGGIDLGLCTDTEFQYVFSVSEGAVEVEPVCTV